MFFHTPRPPVSVHSPEEVARSLAHLTPRQNRQLEAAAHRLFVPSLARIGWQPTDLVQEAKLRTLTGKRRWRTSVTLVRHLYASMKSLVSNLQKGEERQPLLACELESAQSPGAVRFWSLEEAAAHPLLANESAQEQLQNLVQQLRADGAELALWILQLLSRGETPQSIQRQLDLSNSAYCHQLRKIRLYARGQAANFISRPAAARALKKPWTVSDQNASERSICI